MGEPGFVSRRDSSFKELPPASAQTALVIPFYGALTVWVRRPDAPGWHFPMSRRRPGETILDVAKRELWESTRLVAGRFDLLGALRHPSPTPTASYVYMCEVSHLPWSYEMPDRSRVAEIGAFARLPRPLQDEWTESVLEAALRARRTGLR